MQSLRPGERRAGKAGRLSDYREATTDMGGTSAADGIPEAQSNCAPEDIQVFNAVSEQGVKEDGGRAEDLAPTHQTLAAWWSGVSREHRRLKCKP